MLRKITVSLAFIAATFIANAQERTSTTLTDKEIREMTWVEAMQDYRVNFHTVVDKFNLNLPTNLTKKGTAGSNSSVGNI